MEYEHMSLSNLHFVGEVCREDSYNDSLENPQV